MTKPGSDAAAALRALATDDAARSKIGRLRALIEEIETAKSAGVKNRKIVDTLNEHGFDLTLKSFEMMLYRIRKDRRSVPRLSGRADQPAPADDLPEASQIAQDRARRERKARQFIGDKPENPLLKAIKEKHK